jgi:hypothetical protein
MELSAAHRYTIRYTGKPRNKTPKGRPEASPPRRAPAQYFNFQKSQPAQATALFEPAR